MLGKSGTHHLTLIIALAREGGFRKHCFGTTLYFILFGIYKTKHSAILMLCCHGSWQKDNVDNRAFLMTKRKEEKLLHTFWIVFLLLNTPQSHSLITTHCVPRQHRTVRRLQALETLRTCCDPSHYSCSLKNY